jgi:transcription initiation factor TFIIIB Brf1 subunit/transcription initiation factor TFIIB
MGLFRRFEETYCLNLNAAEFGSAGCSCVLSSKMFRQGTDFSDFDHEKEKKPTPSWSIQQHPERNSVILRTKEVRSSKTPHKKVNANPHQDTQR